MSPEATAASQTSAASGSEREVEQNDIRTPPTCANDKIPFLLVEPNEMRVEEAKVGKWACHMGRACFLVQY